VCENAVLYMMRRVWELSVWSIQISRRENTMCHKWNDAKIQTSVTLTQQKLSFSPQQLQFNWHTWCKFQQSFLAYILRHKCL